MATAETLINRVKLVADEPSFTDQDLLEFLNQGIMEIAGGIPLPHGGLSGPLPDLRTTGTVVTATGAASIPLPADFHRELFFAVSATNRYQIEIYESFQRFLKYFPTLDRTGARVLGVARRGKDLFYQPIPDSAETITLHYHRKPDRIILTDYATAEPDGIPEHLQIPLLVNFVAKEVWSHIEQGIDEPKINTQKHTALFMEAVNRLEQSIGVCEDSVWFGVDHDYE